MVDGRKTSPGPWRVAEDGGGLRVLASDQRKTIVAGSIGPASNDQAQADARLIAAAPDLLAACKSAVDEITDSGWLDDAELNLSMEALLARVRAAIAKAEGYDLKAYTDTINSVNYG